MIKRLIILLAGVVMTVSVMAQVGSYRNRLSFGVNGGYQMSNVAFVPKVPQGMLGGMNGGAVMRYTSEKYFSTICAVQLELNYSQMGWKEDILDIHEQPCINKESGLPEEYQRELTYIQVPFMAHLGWGKEEKGFQFFFNLGPQFGYCINEKTTANFSHNTHDEIMNTDPERVSSITAQDTMAIAHKFDYGITAGLGVEYSIPGAGHLQLEARYYFGLGNIFGDTKRDYFSKSNQSSIIVKMAYLFDVINRRKK